MGHPAVAEAAVIAIPDAKWSERPLAVVVLKDGRAGDGGAAARVPLAASAPSGGFPTGSSSSRRSRRPRSASSEDSAARQFADATAEAPRKHPSRPVESRPPPGDRRPRAARARRGAPSPSPATGRCWCACARRGSTSPTCWSARAATRRRRRCRRCSASEVAGEVDGRRVMALPRAAGGYAEAVAVDESLLVPIPDSATLRGGRVVPADVPDRVDPADAAGARRPTARPCWCTPARAASARRRSRSRSTWARASSRPPRRRRSGALCARARRRRGARLRGVRGEVRADVVLDPVGGEVFARSLAHAEPARRARRASASRAAGGSRSTRRRSSAATSAIFGFYLGRLMRHRPRAWCATRSREMLPLWERAR